MKTISPYSFAAVLVLSRLFALSLYTPTMGENAGLTAAISLGLSLVKLLAVIILIRFYDGSVSGISEKVKSGVIGVLAACFIVAAGAEFSIMVESVYPYRFSKLGITIVLFIVCAYVASMGAESLSRTSAILIVSFVAALAFIFFEMRETMFTDRINLYSYAPYAEIKNTVSNLMAQLYDIVIFFGLLPRVRGSGKKAACIYILSDAMIYLVFFLMSAAVMGDFFPKSGYSFFTLSYSTHGAIIDRSDGAFLAISSACAVITIAALMIVLHDHLIKFITIKNDANIYTAAALILTSVLLALQSRKVILDGIAADVSILTIGLLLIGAAVSALKRKGVRYEA